MRRAYTTHKKALYQVIMIESVAVFLVEAICQVLITLGLSFPGAAVRWVFLRNRKSYNELLQDDPECNMLVFLLSVGVIVAIAALIKHL